jgi:tetratricopeptide (TPR) repeat protein
VGQTFTLSEVQRIAGLEAGRLRYLERLRLIRPHSRWGQRFYSFSDLVALQTIHHLSALRIPARRLGRAIVALERQLGVSRLSLDKLSVVPLGRAIAIVPPGTQCPPIEPLSGQFVLYFEAGRRAARVTQIISRNAQQWFDRAVAYDARPEASLQAVAAWRRVVVLAPHWVDARILLGLALCRVGEFAEAEQSFRIVIQIAPESADARFHLGSLLGDLQDFSDAALHLRHAIRINPRHFEAHFNLAMVLERLDCAPLARQHWRICLRLNGSGDWADYARSRVAALSGRRSRRLAALIPFRKRTG